MLNRIHPGKYTLFSVDLICLTILIARGRRNWLHLGSKEAGPKIAAYKTKTAP